MLGHVWSIWQQNVGLNQIIADWYILSYAAKWHGERSVQYNDQRNQKNIEDDRGLCAELRVLLNDADIVVTQNGIAFDIKKIFARMVQHGMQPPSSFKQIDTKIIASKTFAFTSNKLEYLADKLAKKYKKLKVKKFIGHELWTECMKGNVKAWNEMKRYNIRDVFTTEEVYEVLRPWGARLPNFSLYTDSTSATCRCGGTELKKQGFAYTTVGKFQRYQCKACGTEFRDRINLLSSAKRKSLLVNVAQ